jgi:NlpC/P60 family
MRAYQAAGSPSRACPETSTGQAGTSPRASSSPGDLVFYTHAEESTIPAGIGHVAMYLGHGRVIEAAHRGMPVRIASMHRPDPLAAATRPAAASSGLPSVQYGQRGNAVPASRHALPPTAPARPSTGSSAPSPHRAVLGFQAAHGLARDGVAGPAPGAP